ncbi:aminotransferase-like domain-containing protein [Paracraurococcus lichenis]|uniref:PLP-dependent aminotransferase family protein n=1 Tax=Paracraurococcus lichenis TaxID=3064888 RepID=A0ABT9DTR2_9PROT|nr:PLP-dependent aminotransferase family protein [Paracraurococcus sp. LOR1-02]MDO9707268.1 PLP-dependent aminotransferase family protein [Paracraurococcus sp. LOR1-02]
MSPQPGPDYARLFRKGAPEPTPRFTGFPKYNFVGGHNDPTRVPVAALAEAAAAALTREGASLALYNLGHGPQGHAGMRDLVVDKLRRHRGVACTRDDVLITSGSLQGLDLVNDLLLEPGDTVLVEELSYGGALSRIRKRGVTIVPVALDGEGMRMDALSDALDGLKARGVVPKYLYTIPTIQNPTGSILPLERRQQMLSLARAHGVPVFEDECYADLIWAGAQAPPALYALDPAQVIHIGSFSKTLAPALRAAYAVAPWPVLSRLLSLKTDGGTGAVEQMLVAEYFSKHFDSHVAALSGVLEGKLQAMLEAVAREFGSAAECFVPKGGIFLWLKLPEAVDVRKLVKPAAERGIQFNPGPEWACDPESAKSQLRLCFALPSKEEIREGVAAFARVCYEQTGIPAQSGNIRHAPG